MRQILVQPYLASRSS